MKPSDSFSNMIARREMLRRCLRWGGLAGLTAVATVLAARTARNGCVKASPCGECPLFTGCDLPKARQSKPAPPPPPGHV